MAGRGSNVLFSRALFCGVGLAGGRCLARVSRGFSDVVGGETEGRLVAVSDWRRSYFWAVLPPCCPVRIGRSGSNAPLILPRPTLSLGRRRPGEREMRNGKCPRLQLRGLGGRRVDDGPRKDGMQKGKQNKHGQWMAPSKATNAKGGGCPPSEASLASPSPVVSDRCQPSPPQVLQVGRTGGAAGERGMVGPPPPHHGGSLPVAVRAGESCMVGWVAPVPRHRNQPPLRTTTPKSRLLRCQLSGTDHGQRFR